MLSALVCDNSPLLRKEISLLLQDKGFTEILEASDGPEALRVFNTHRVDLVVMDIILPKQDGISVLKEVMEIQRNLPVIMTSSCSQGSHLRRTRFLGAAAYIQKPITAGKMTEALDAAALAQLEPEVHASSTAGGK
ncbi:response regulator transcription factor [Alkalicoccus urumqiensis]|nr:response regulator [Alkalicoccus urumqiensis]